MLRVPCLQFAVEEDSAQVPEASREPVHWPIVYAYFVAFAATSLDAEEVFCEFNRGWSRATDAEPEETRRVGKVRLGCDVHSQFRGRYRRDRTSRHRRPNRSREPAARALSGHSVCRQPEA